MGIIGIVLIALLIFFCCRNKGLFIIKLNTNFFFVYYLDRNRRSSFSSIESFQQLFFTKIPHNQIKTLEQRVIERWSSIDQPSITFYR